MSIFSVTAIVVVLLCSSRFVNVRANFSPCEVFPPPLVSNSWTNACLPAVSVSALYTVNAEVAALAFSWFFPFSALYVRTPNIFVICDALTPSSFAALFAAALGTALPLGDDIASNSCTIAGGVSCGAEPRCASYICIYRCCWHERCALLPPPMPQASACHKQVQEIFANGLKLSFLYETNIGICNETVFLEVASHPARYDTSQTKNLNSEFRILNSELQKPCFFTIKLKKPPNSEFRIQNSEFRISEF